jgi:hypothetical protein
MLRTLTTRLLATIALALPATLALGQAVEIKRVENYGGSAVVSTDAKNESIVVTALDADKKPVESWTVTTDADGRTTVPAGYNLAAGYVRARKAGAMPDLITPTNVVAGEVVMLCAPRAIEGQTVEIKTLAGEVVASPKADSLGRILLASGLAAGAYLVSTPRGERPLNVVDGLGATGNVAFQSLDQPAKCPLAEVGGDPRTWTADVQGGPSGLPVLASSGTEAVLPALAPEGAFPGSAKLTVTDSAGQPLGTTTCVLYQADSRLTKTTVPEGTQTTLVVDFQPAITGQVTASILNGPVAFTDGSSRTVQELKDGHAEFPLQAQSGTAGGFQIQWELGGAALNEKPGTEALDDPEWIVLEDGTRIQIVRDKDGVREEVILHPDGSTTFKRIRKGKHRRTEDVETVSADKKSKTVEHWEFKDGEFVSATRETFEAVGKGWGGPTKKEVWDPKRKDWVPPKKSG